MSKLSSLMFFLLPLIAALTHGGVEAGGHKIVTYWGQNGCSVGHGRSHWEKDLMVFCQNYNYDTIVLSFLNVFFDTANKNNMPGFNFAYHCEKGVSELYPTVLRCPKIEDAILECQKNGKKVMMSLGGAAGAYGFTDDNQAKLFAYRVYHLLLEGTDLQNIRPFGRAVLNGVDLDIEGGPPTGYTAFIKELRRLESSGTQKITIAAAPQCPFPDAIQGPSPGHFLGDVPQLIDEVYVQFYNNWCYIGGSWRGAFDSWIKYSAKTNGPKIFIGVPAAPKAGGGYTSPAALGEIYRAVRNEPRLGGIMMWDAGFDQNNVIGGKHFSDHVGDFMGKKPQPTHKPITLPPQPTTHKPPTQKPGPTKKPTPQPYYKDCKGLEDGLYPMRDCRKYLQCQGGETFVMSCPAGLFFNPKINACDWPEHVDCKLPSVV